MRIGVTGQDTALCLDSLEKTVSLISEAHRCYLGTFSALWLYLATGFPRLLDRPIKTENHPPLSRCFRIVGVDAHIDPFHRFAGGCGHPPLQFYRTAYKNSPPDLVASLFGLLALDGSP